MHRWLTHIGVTALVTLLMVPTAWAATIQWPDGSRFEGELRGGKMEGPGALRWSNGTFYKGDFSNSLPHGKGRLLWPNGVYYEGDFKQGNFDGVGLLMESPDHYFVGEFQANQPQGMGIRRKEDIIDGGLWEKGMADPVYNRSQPNRIAGIQTWHEAVLIGDHALIPVEPFLTRNGWIAKTTDAHFPVSFEKNSCRLFLQAANPVARLDNKPKWLSSTPILHQTTLYADIGDLLSLSGQPALDRAYFTPPASTQLNLTPLHTPSRQLLRYGPARLEKAAFAPSDGSRFGAPLVARDGSIYVGTEAGTVYALGADGSEKWRYDAGGAVVTAPTVTQDRILVAASKQIVALDGAGALQWTLSAPVREGGLTAAPDGTVWAVSDEGVLLRIAAATGDILTTVRTPCSPAFPPLVASDGTIYAAGDKRLNAFSPSGECKWSVKTGGAIYGSPALHPDGTVYMATLDGSEPVPRARKMTLFALDSATGEEKWKTRILGGDHPSGIAVGWNGIYVATDSELLALSSTGQILWQTSLLPSTGSRFIAGAPVIDLSGTLFVNANVFGDARIIAVDPQGKVLATQAVKGVISGPMTLDTFGNLIAGAEELLVIR
ncbi:PQQ-binding-like beta-propeller repeat protein [Heliobacterium gestii]|uniref:PQQ-binding-like beta-propeller repeat protein n=1 Tax=Heliomicrobium gestii TaxID=2699 RepID=A0A845L8Q2_HELGE|nr:PQQ-binding-like beta-propeller repeat protein [Heliomicrobium gestii]MBM7865723.1 outer membrane protein assembly factor BamB [Heliomicrobium gestii]MZP41971.1 PQQ-binding-like beta-propeller repeat protein [Heliomicrobium gestii]